MAEYEPPDYPTLRTKLLPDVRWDSNVDYSISADPPHRPDEAWVSRAWTPPSTYNGKASDQPTSPVLVIDVLPAFGEHFIGHDETDLVRAGVGAMHSLQASIGLCSAVVVSSRVAEPNDRIAEGFRFWKWARSHFTSIDRFDALFQSAVLTDYRLDLAGVVTRSNTTIRCVYAGCAVYEHIDVRVLVDLLVDAMERKLPSYAWAAFLLSGSARLTQEEVEMCALAQVSHYSDEFGDPDPRLVPFIASRPGVVMATSSLIEYGHGHKGGRIVFSTHAEHLKDLEAACAAVRAGSRSASADPDGTGVG